MPQDSADEPVEILSLDDIVSPVTEAREFQRRINGATEIDQTLIGICLDFDLGFCDAITSLKRLEAGGYIETASMLMALISAGVRTLSHQKEHAL